jgi:hypothetical protein
MPVNIKVLHTFFYISIICFLPLCLDLICSKHIVRKNIKFLSTSVFTLNISVRLGIGELRVM